MNRRRLVLRVDGGPEVGWGHVARCFALAQAWVDSGDVATIASRLLPTEWARRCDLEGIEVRGSDALAFGDADWVVLDGYHFTATDRRTVESSRSRVVVIDDHGLSDTTLADVIVDQNLGAGWHAYPERREASVLLAGPRYALLRREFRQHRNKGRVVPSRARRLLASLGGSPTPTTEAAFERVEAAVELAGIEVVRLSGVDDVATVMADADLAFAASGATCWELCCMGVPVMLVSVADNQLPLARALAADGIAQDAGPVEAIDPPAVARALAQLAGQPSLRAEMSRRGQDLVDGCGAGRVVAALKASSPALGSRRRGSPRP